jgi:very-short-patch-repair endonuclease
MGDLTALVLDIGEPCWISGQTAAALWGFDTFNLGPPFHVTLPRERQVHRVGALVHTTDSMPLLDRARLDGLPLMSATRTIVNLARSEPNDRLTTALDSALRDGLTSEVFMHGRIADLRGSGRYGVPRLLDVIDGAELSRGGHSWLERRFLELIGIARLPRPRTQQVLTRTRNRTVRVDCHFEEVPLVVELLGYRWHRTKEQMARDAQRVNALQLAGYVVLQFTYEQLALEPHHVVAELTEALTRLGRTS